MKIRKHYKLKLDIAEILFCLIALLGFLSLLFTIFYNENLLRIFSYGFFVLGYALCAYSMIKNRNINVSLVFLFSFFLFVIFLWIFSGFEYKVITVELSFFLIFSSFDVAKQIPHKDRLINIIYILYLLQSILFIIVSFTNYAHFSSKNSILDTNYLLLGLGNPNETGIALAYTVIGLFISSREKIRFCRLFHYHKLCIFYI